jgi:transaldolase
MTRPKTKILVDGGDPQETRQVKELLGFVDGQTTNPSLIAKNPHIKELIASGHKLSNREEMDEYKKIVQTISPLVGDAGVSIEVFSDEKTTAQEMFSQGQEMFSWIPNAYIKYPCTTEGLRAAQNSVKQGMRVNMTLCFSQQQAAAVYAATKGTKEPAYVSPFVGRLDDIGQNGMDVVKNIKRMFSKGDGHVLVLAASMHSSSQFRREVPPMAGLYQAVECNGREGCRRCPLPQRDSRHHRCSLSFRAPNSSAPFGRTGRI